MLYFRSKFTLDKRARAITWTIFILIALANAAQYIFFHNEGNYVSVWAIFFAVSILALFILSFPRYVVVENDTLEIHCVVQMVRLAVEEIEYVKKIDRSEMNRCMPLIGSFGFGGYYGSYMNLRYLHTFKLFAGEWNNFVKIKTIYEEYYIISVADADGLIETVARCKGAANAL